MKEDEFDNNLKKAIIAQERKALKKQLRNVEQNLYKPKKTNWFIAASIALVFGFSGYYFLLNKQPTNQELFYAYYQPYENTVAPIIRGKSELTKKQEAFVYYDTKNYYKAIVAFENLIDISNKEKSELTFYKAIAYLELSEPKKSKMLLLRLINHENREWQKESLWYLALTELKLKNVEKAKTHLNNLILLKTNYKKSEAKALLKQLK